MFKLKIVTVIQDISKRVNQVSKLRINKFRGAHTIAYMHAFTHGTLKLFYQYFTILNDLCQLSALTVKYVGWGSLVCIVTHYRLDGWGSNPGGSEIFRTCPDL
jgi:hypothetical protein